MFKAKRTRTFLGLAVIVCVVYLVWQYMGAKDTEAGKAVERIVRDPSSLVAALQSRREGMAEAGLAPLGTDYPPLGSGKGSTWSGGGAATW